MKGNLKELDFLYSTFNLNKYLAYKETTDDQPFYIYTAVNHLATAIKHVAQSILLILLNFSNDSLFNDAKKDYKTSLKG